jgi:hypothetical protein
MNELYIPNGAISLDKIEHPQVRLGIQADSGEGKSWAAATFPNPTFYSMDRGLIGLLGRSDIYELPFYDAKFVDNLVRRKSGEPPNVRDAVYNHLRDEGPKFKPEQTAVLDALSDLEIAFDRQIKLEPVYTDNGKIDKYADWRRKINYFDDLATLIKSLPCSVILICHEQVDRDSKGELNGKVKPMLTGQAGDKIRKNFTDWYRQIAADKKPADKVTAESLKLWGFKTVSEYMAMQETFTGNTLYFWQTESDDIFSAKRSLFNCPRFIPARYESYKKYLKISPVSAGGNVQ